MHSQVIGSVTCFLGIMDRYQVHRYRHRGLRSSDGCSLLLVFSAGTKLEGPDTKVSGPSFSLAWAEPILCVERAIQPDVELDAVTRQDKNKDLPQLQPLVAPQVSHFSQVPLRTMVKFWHSEQELPV